MRRSPSSPSLLGSVSRFAVIGLLAFTVTACKNRGGGDITGSIGAQGATSGADLSVDQMEALGKRYEANPTDRNAALAYARALRAREQNAQAMAVLENAAMRNPKDSEILGAFGRSLMDVGRYKQAQAVLARAHSPDRPDWRILSAQGSVADQLGEHDIARTFYETALKIVPDEPSVLSNLGLSYALTKQLSEAEKTLRKAAQNPKADQRVRQNLALVLGLQGKMSEAENLIRRDLRPQDAEANIRNLRAMVAQPNSWGAIRQVDGKADRKEPKKRSVAAKPETVSTSSPPTQDNADGAL